MPITNLIQLLTQAAAFPAAVEAKLPAGAPVISQMLLDTAAKLPAVPDLPIEIPDLPAPPELPAFPEFPAPPGNGGLKTRFVKEVTVTPLDEVGAPGAAARQQAGSKVRFLY